MQNITKEVLGMLHFLDAQVLKAKAKIAQFLADEKGEVNIVTIVVLIGIAVALALIFKEQITNLLTTLFGTITEKANTAIS